MRAYLTIAVFLSVSLSTLRAQQPLASCVGIDANGVRHTWECNPAKPSPYVADTTKRVPPDYSYDARKARLEGTGLFRLHINVTTGRVINVAVLKSTGAAILDRSVLSALRRWQFKPRTWKEVDTPVTFSTSPQPRL